MQEIEYPCEWSYRLICTDENSANLAADRVFGSRDYALNKRNESAKGSFVSIDLSCSVNTEEDRKNLNDLLLQQTGVKMIL
jgi:uncharacterized protein